MKNWKHHIIIVLLCVFWMPDSWAKCFKITKTNNNPTNNSYTEPGMGDVVSWSGADDHTGSAGTIAGNLNLPANTTLDDGEKFLPDGTLLASGTVRFTEMGSVPYTPETILFRCSADEEGKLYEFYSTNGDQDQSGKVEVGAAIGQEESYQTDFDTISSRITNLATGEYYSRYWKRRPLVNLDRDSYGWILVKAKNFSDAKIELFKNSFAKGSKPSGDYTLRQPLAYIAFQGGTFSSGLYDGADHKTVYSGWPHDWPGAINLFNRVSLTRILTCKLTQTTSLVTFPPIAAPRLMQGQEVTQPIDIDFVCQTTASSDDYTGFQSGTNPGQTAIGFVINAENATAARQEGLEYFPGSVTHLLSDGYGKNPDAPTGVGVRITSDGSNDTIDLFDDIATPGNDAMTPWYPVLENASAVGGNRVSRRYKARYYATLERLPGKQVTPGYFHATMQVVIKVL